MNPEDVNEINNFLKSTPVNRNYKVKVGETVKINLPSIPLTGATEFLQLEQEIHGDRDSLLAEAVPLEGEGYLSPRQVINRAVCPGKVNIVVKAVDSLSGEEVPGIDPFNIEVNIEEN